MSKQEEQEAAIRLILLALVERLPGILLNDLHSLAQESLFFNYFDVAEASSNLLNKKLLILSEQKNEKLRDAAGNTVKRVFLSEEGAAVLESLRHMLPTSMKPVLDGLERRETAREDIKASYQADGDYQYQVELEANEKGRRLIHLSLSVPDENRARNYCQNWKKQASKIYLAILENLDCQEK